ncbi:hypothetical protein OG592_29280 [Streptomyces avidinii]|uniref:hypothetical protein n=1 Tax=Streptomyces avidinii TaxID=1895 RepID=UPI00386AD30E|nr:hypothetical protein OG592_29280 [Streptomyces avidinii]
MTTQPPHHDCEPRPGTCRLPEPWMCEVFHVDGSLRDITVTGTDDTDWQQVLHHFRGAADQLTWYDGPEAHDIGPDDTEDPFAGLEDGYTASLSVRCGNTRFTAHLPVDGIEFSLWPDDVEDGAHVADVLRFLTELAAVCGRPAVLTAETVTGHHELPPLITYDPSTGTVTHL